VRFAEKEKEGGCVGGEEKGGDFWTGRTARYARKGLIAKEEKRRVTYYSWRG